MAGIELGLTDKGLTVLGSPVLPVDVSGLTQVLAGVCEWLRPEAPGERLRAAELKEACVAMTPTVGAQSSWADLVTVNLAVRLIELIDSWQACLSFAAYLADPGQPPSADLRAAAAQARSRPSADAAL